MNKTLLYWSLFQRGKYKLFKYKSEGFMGFYKIKTLKNLSNKYCKLLYRALKNSQNEDTSYN